MKFVMLHIFGLGLNVMSICMFAMFHSLSGGIKRAKYWVCMSSSKLINAFSNFNAHIILLWQYYMVLGSFALVTLLTFMWMQMGIAIENENDKRAYFGYVLAAVAEMYQVFWPAIVRVVRNFFSFLKKNQESFYNN
jgi:ABC-type microcin C transport system permease subunit YejE